MSESEAASADAGAVLRALAHAEALGTALLDRMCVGRAPLSTLRAQQLTSHVVALRPGPMLTRHRTLARRFKVCVVGTRRGPAAARAGVLTVCGRQRTMRRCWRRWTRWRRGRGLAICGCRPRRLQRSPPPTPPQRRRPLLTAPCTPTCSAGSRRLPTCGCPLPEGQTQRPRGPETPSCTAHVFMSGRYNERGGKARKGHTMLFFWCRRGGRACAKAGAVSSFPAAAYVQEV
jgi:hypothetical protein